LTVNGGGEVLIASDANGEGAFIAEAATLGSKGKRTTVRRASKELADVNWTGSEYAERFHEVAHLVEYLNGSSIEWIVLDESAPASVQPPHLKSLAEALLSPGSRFDLVQASLVHRRSGSGPVQIFRRRSGSE
jgi:hypothetical protein